MELKKILLLVVILVIVPAGVSDKTLGSDDSGNQNNRARHREKHWGDRQGRTWLKPVTHRAYKDSCGACHFAYQAELLPSSSWEGILEAVDDHFGEAFKLDQETKDAVFGYLGSNASEHSKSKVAVKIMKSLRGQVPMRITEIPYIKDKHRRISAATFKRDSIGSASNCVACHKRAEEGIYDDDYVVIPE